jgi:hypothetical protein
LHILATGRWAPAADIVFGFDAAIFGIAFVSFLAAPTSEVNTIESKDDDLITGNRWR